MLAQHCAACVPPRRGCVRASRRGRGGGRGAAVPRAAPRASAAAEAAADAVPERVAHARRAGVLLRRASWADVQPVAQLCAAAFADVPGNIPKGNPNVEGLSEYLVTSYVAATSRQVTKAMALALSQKETAATEMRRVRATRRAAALRVALSTLNGAAAASTAAPVDAADAEALVARLLRDGEAAQPAWPPAERARLLRTRQWTCLLARDEAGTLLGCAVISWRVPDAALPAPFPSSRPQRLYLSNMSVDPSARRRGVARALLAAAEATAAAWGQSALWLHVDVPNEGARALYDATGFQPAAEGQDPWFLPREKRRVLLTKAVPPRT